MEKDIGFKMKLKEIIQGVIDACQDTNLHADDNTVLDCSIRIFNRMGINEETKQQRDIKKPTQKQIETLKKFNIKNINNLTFEEAKQIIGEKISSFKKTK